jgi:hypothetical protein
MFLQDHWVEIAVVGGIVIGLPYGIAPMLIKSKSVFSAEKKYEPILLAAIPPEAQQAFDMATRGLAAAGFRAIGHVRAERPVTGVEDSYVSVWANTATSDVAQVISVRARGIDGNMKTDPLVTFRRE